MSNNKQVAKNMIFSIISFAINLGISFFFTPYLIRTVGTEAYGFFPLTNTIIGYTSIVTAAIGSMAGRFIIMEFYGGSIDKAKTYYTTVIGANIALSLLFSVVGIFGLFFLEKVINIPPYLETDVKILFGLTLLCLVISLPLGILNVGLSVKNVNHFSAYSTATSNLVRVGIMFILYWLFKPTIIYIGIAGVGSMIVGLGYGFFFKKRFLPEISFSPHTHFDIKAVWELASSGIWNSINQLSNVLLQGLDLLIANIFISAAVTGEYALAKTMPGLIYTVLAMFSGAFYPQFNILYAKKNYLELRHEINKSIKIMSALMGIPIGLLIVYGENFFTLWVPSQDAHELAMLSAITLLPMIFGSSVNPVFGVFTITNKLRVPSLVLLFSGLAQTVIVVLLLKYTSLGIYAIAIVSAVQGGLRNFLFTPQYAARCLGFQRYSLYRPIIKGCIGMSLIIVVGYIFNWLYTPETWVALLSSFIIVGAVVLIMNFFVIFNSSDRYYILTMLKKRLSLIIC